jgi:exonuclease III
VCYQCGCPNFDSSIFGTRSFESTNPFSTLSESIVEDDNTGEDYPKTSTPTDPNSEHKFRKFSPPKNRKNKISAMVINCNGLKGIKKQAAFRAAVEHHNPDIIMGCESKISPNIATYSVFPENYTFYRKDRNENGGGVFLAVRDAIISADIPDLNPDCEVVWASLQFSNSKPLYIASYYGPHKKKPKSIDELAKSLSTIFSKQRSKSPNVIIGGDFNYPDINWDLWSTTNPKTASDHRGFLNFLVENSLAQLVMKVTRPISNSILDLITTTNPQLVSNIEVYPGISDHNIVTFDINMKPKQQNKPPRKIHNFQKADHATVKDKVANSHRSS